jgi:hypothetical protein
VSSQIELIHVSLLDMSGRIFFGLDRFLAFRSGWIEFWVNPCLAHLLLWVKSYGPCPPIALVGSGWIRFFSCGPDKVPMLRFTDEPDVEDARGRV